MSEKTNDAQISPVVPLWFGEISAEGLDEDLVFVELEDDVRQPPVLLTVHAIAIVRRAARLGTVERLLDDIGDWHAGW